MRKDIATRVHWQNADGIIPSTAPATFRYNEYAFRDCTGLTSITFTGTKSEWGAIDKDYNWKQNASINQVICQDGTLTGNKIG